MTAWDAIEIVAWIISGGIALWMIADVIRVSREYDEDFLTTAVEIEETEELIDKREVGN
ncbi:hypothetical protein [Rubrobacter xylanophilus]|uniref:hypothetical protein n=1 Tax=Rubrobacter xylanophilus TaxID=49319 RepID=UPI0012EAAA30|nr:hypothetical protein [Rubrobacter xylanophilus]